MRRGWGLGPGEERRPRPPRALVVALLLACASLMVLDRAVGADGGRGLDPLRAAVGGVVGPAQTGVADVVRPVTGLSGWFEDQQRLRDQVATLQAENSDLRSQVRTRGYDLQRLAEFEGLTSTAARLTLDLVPARVVAVGSSQSFSATVTIDAGSRAGVRPDMTVLNDDGLVGRVLRTTPQTATVLLIIDPDAVVGARIAPSMDLGFVRGSGSFADDARLQLDLVDTTVVPHRADPVVTWGDDAGAGPFVPGVPIGEVTAVYSSLRETTQRAELRPFVDFGSLDLVGVVVPAGTPSDRGLIAADGSIG